MNLVLYHNGFTVLRNTSKPTKSITSPESSGCCSEAAHQYLCLPNLERILDTASTERGQLSKLGIAIIKIRRSHNSLIFMMDIPIPGNVFILKHGPGQRHGQVALEDQKSIHALDQVKWQCHWLTSLHGWPEVGQLTPNRLYAGMWLHNTWQQPQNTGGPQYSTALFVSYNPDYDEVFKTFLFQWASPVVMRSSIQGISERSPKQLSSDEDQGLLTGWPTK